MFIVLDAFQAIKEKAFSVIGRSKNAIPNRELAISREDDLLNIRQK